MVNWDDEDIKEFKKSARAAQQEYCDLLGDREWDAITKLDWTVLRRKVGFGVYGPPSSVPTEDNRQTGYNKEQLNVVEQICCQMVENLNFTNHSIYFACLFVIVKVHERTYTVPVFKAKSSLDRSQQCIFVDTGARKYGSWDDYLSDNTLEKCIFCYPTLGVYENNGDSEVCIKFGTSPACNLISRTFNLFDTVATVATVAATGVGLAALCTIPVAGPIMAASAIAGASTGAYGVTRSAYALYDRASHSQSIGLSDSDARGCWLSIVGSSLGFAQGRMIASMTNAARAGDVMGKAGRIAFLLVQTGSLTVNGIGIVHGLAVLIDKHEREQLTALDIFQFSTSVLFFTNAALNAKTASTIIKEVQHEVIDSHRAVLNSRAKKVFNKKTGMLRGPDEMHGNAKVVKHLVKDLKTIETTKDLYEMMANKNVNERKVKLTPDGFKGMLNVNKNLKVHPMKLLEIPSETRQTIFQSTKHLQNGTLSRKQFHADMKNVCREYRISFETMREDTVNKLCQMFGKERLNDIKVGGKKIFVSIEPHYIDRMRVVMENTIKNSDLILENATKFAAARDCSDPKAFISHAEFFVAVLNDEIRSYEASYHNDLAVAKNNLDFNQAQFDKSCGIPAGMKRVKFHEQKALDFFSSEDGFAKLNKQYDTLKATVGPLNAKSQLGFFGNDAATYHYMKHKFFDDKELTPEQYFKIAEEVIGEPTNKTNSILSQDGSCVMITYLEKKRGVRAIKIDKGEGSGIATVMYDPKVQNDQ